MRLCLLFLVLVSAAIPCMANSLRSGSCIAGAGRSSGGGIVLSYVVGSLQGATLSLESGSAPASTPSAGAPLITDLSGAYAYPTPFRPARGHSHITFANLPLAATIRIYTSSGELVATLRNDDGASSLAWPAVNRHGSALASGVYHYVIGSPGAGSHKGKIMVIR